MVCMQYDIRMSFNWLLFISVGALNIGAIVGGSVGGVALIAFVVVVIIIIVLVLIFKRDTKTASECYQ